MKHKKLIITLFALVAVLSACKKEKEPIAPSPEYPKEISITDYSLGVSSDCHWGTTGLWQIDFMPYLNVINSDEELVKCMDPWNNCAYTKIDFSKHTLLLVRRRVQYGLLESAKQLFRLSENDYELRIEETLCDVPNLQRRFFAVLTDKLDDESNVKLKVKSSFTKIEEQNVSDMELGMYVATNLEWAKINFIDNEKFVLLSDDIILNEFKYKVHGYLMNVTVTEDSPDMGVYFYIINNRKFEMNSWFVITPIGNLEPLDNVIFEKEWIQ